MNSLIQLSEVDMMKTKNNKNRPYKVDGLRDVEMVFQRRIAEARIFFETFLAALRALQLTFGESAEAVGTLRGFPLRGGRRGLRTYNESKLSFNVSIFPLDLWSLDTSRTFQLSCASLCEFCRAQTSALVPFVRLLRTHATASTAMSLFPLHLQNLCAFAPLRLSYTSKPEAKVR